MPARNTLVQLLALYTNPKSHSAQRHGQTTYDGNTALCTKVHRAVKITNNLSDRIKNAISQRLSVYMHYSSIKPMMQPLGN